MKHLRKLPSAVESELMTEISLPVCVRYRADENGEIEITLVTFASTPLLLEGARLLWHRLPASEVRALAEKACAKDREDLAGREAW